MLSDDRVRILSCRPGAGTSSIPAAGSLASMDSECALVPRMRSLVSRPGTRLTRQAVSLRAWIALRPSPRVLRSSKNAGYGAATRRA
jgi:hypothetical protein